jgi:hypothetical protein
MWFDGVDSCDRIEGIERQVVDTGWWGYVLVVGKINMNRLG